MLKRAQIDGAHVIIAVGRCEAPSAATAFYGKQKGERLLLRELVEFVLDLCMHVWA